MSYDDAKLCLPPKARLHSKEPEGEIYFVGKTMWVLYEDESGWNCSRPDKQKL